MNSDLLLILVATAFGFLVKGVAGFGGPLLAIPILAPSLGVEHAVVAVSLGNVVSNLMMMVEHRSGWADTKQLLIRLLVAGAVGTVLGTWLLTRLDNRPLALAVAAMVITYIIVTLRRPGFRIDRERGLRLVWPVGVVGGLVHGATGNSGPVFGTFMHSLGLARASFVFSITIPFLVFGTIQVLTLAGLGSFSGERLNQALWAVVPVLVVIPIGTRIARRLDQRTFARLVLILLAAAALRLVLSVFGI
ncbi:MAG TPA: sulfite exporter TauE/SafE family protein [Acidimicrobiia bacterium]|nr:sulfite exporter TauE/SafE family protein [Acidimicrobiia bacterium]